jgi:hypothetical protein
MMFALLQTLLPSAKVVCCNIHIKLKINLNAPSFIKKKKTKEKEGEPVSFSCFRMTKHFPKNNWLFS